MHLVDPKWSINRNGYAHSCLALGFAHDATKSENGPQKKKIESFNLNVHAARCLKITEKVSFKIASEASYVYILSGQKFIKNAENGPFWRVFDNLKLAVKQCYQTGEF